MSVTLILGSLADTAWQARYSKTTPPKMVVPSESIHPWRWIWLDDQWWRAYHLPHLAQEPSPNTFLWLINSTASDPELTGWLTDNNWKPEQPISLYGGPLRCLSTVIDRKSHQLVHHNQVVWVPGSLIPTQRTWACFDTEINIRVRCGEFIVSGGSVTAVVIVAHDEDVVSRSRPYYANRGLLPPKWQERVRQCDAMSADVAYLLNAPVVRGVDIHHVDLLHPDDLSGGLPLDVKEELAQRLQVLGINLIEFEDNT